MVAARGSAHPAREVELKLEFSPADTARLVSHPALAPDLGPAEECDLISTYFDTPDCALHKKGVYLRVREAGGRFLQTIKTAKSATEMFERYEWERELPDRRPDLDSAKGTALEPFLTPEIRAALRPVFETRIRRRIHRLLRNGSEIEAAIDRGEISTRAQTCPICELELELRSGDKRELFRLARAIAAELPLRIEVKTKAERGFELHAGRRLEAEKAAPLDVPPDMPVGEAFRAIALGCLRQIVANEPAVCAGQSEALHQMRIGVRRLRAAITIFADIARGEEMERIKAELRWIMRELGPARELDVFAADVLAPLRASRPEDVRATGAHRDFEQRRKQAYVSAANAIQSDRFHTAIFDIAEWIEIGAMSEVEDRERKRPRARAVAEHARKELAKLRKKIKRKGADLRHLSVAQRHRLRIAAKRLRYATEFFASTFPGEAAGKLRTESLKALKDMQDSLGSLNDLATHRALVADHLEGEAKDSASSRLAASEPQAETLLRKAEQAFARFAGTKSFWKA
jgi:triphosphatase